MGVSQVWMLSRTEKLLDPAVIRQTIRLFSHVQSRRNTNYAILAASHIDVCRSYNIHVLWNRDVSGKYYVLLCQLMTYKMFNCANLLLFPDFPNSTLNWCRIPPPSRVTSCRNFIPTVTYFVALCKLHRNVAFCVTVGISIHWNVTDTKQLLYPDCTLKISSCWYKPQPFHKLDYLGGCLTCTVFEFIMSLHFASIHKAQIQSDTKKTGTFEKPNKNWRNPRKKNYWQKLNHYNLHFKRQ